MSHQRTLIIEGIAINVLPDRVTYKTPWYRVDGDGDPLNKYRDPCWQRNTSLHGPDGKPIDASKMPFVVLNPYIAACLPAVFLGALALVTYKGVARSAVIGDIGPPHKVGEGSEALASSSRSRVCVM